MRTRRGDSVEVPPSGFGLVWGSSFPPSSSVFLLERYTKENILKYGKKLTAPKLQLNIIHYYFKSMLITDIPFNISSRLALKYRKEIEYIFNLPGPLQIKKRASYILRSYCLLNFMILKN